MNIKSFLKEWGFHHSWGVWISDTDKNIRAKIQHGKNSWNISFTKDGFGYKSCDRYFFHKKEEQHWEAIKEDIVKKLLDWV